MNRLYKKIGDGLEYRVVMLFLDVAIGASGAPTIAAAKSKGITSITRNSAGKYTIVADDRYVGLMGAVYTVVLAAGDPGPTKMVVRADNSAAAAKSVVVEFLNDAGTATEIANGATLKLRLSYRASSA